MNASTYSVMNGGAYRCVIGNPMGLPNGFGLVDCEPEVILIQSDDDGYDGDIEYPPVPVFNQAMGQWLNMAQDDQMDPLGEHIVEAWAAAHDEAEQAEMIEEMEEINGDDF